MKAIREPGGMSGRGCDDEDKGGEESDGDLLGVVGPGRPAINGVNQERTAVGNRIAGRLISSDDHWGQIAPWRARARTGYWRAVCAQSHSHRVANRPAAPRLDSGYNRRATRRACASGRARYRLLNVREKRRHEVLQQSSRHQNGADDDRYHQKIFHAILAETA